MMTSLLANNYYHLNNKIGNLEFVTENLNKKYYIDNKSEIENLLSDQTCLQIQLTLVT